jgi:hypothetical protein
VVYYVGVNGGEHGLEVAVETLVTTDLPWFLVYGADPGSDDDDGAGDGGGDGDNTDGDGDGDNTDGDGDDDEWVPPTKEEWEELVTGQGKLIGALRKASAQASRRKARLRELQTGGAGSGDTDGDDDDGGTAQPDPQPARDRDLARAAARATQQVEDKYKPLVAKAAITEALRDAGWNGKNPTLVMRMLNLDEVDIEVSDGVAAVTGVEGQIAELKEEFPAWFRKHRPAAKRSTDGDDKGTPKRPTGDWRTQIGRAFG